jgi:molybdate transport system substrate-binding protein
MVAAALLSGCAAQQSARPQLTVYAAASLTSSFSELVEAFAESHPGLEVLPPVFDGSSTLATQLIEGAPADVFASADLVTMQRVEQAGLLVGEPQLFATNTLQIAVAPGNPHGISTVADLADPRLDVVLCAPEVPCGATAHALLGNAGVDFVAASEEQNVTAVATKVRLGEADAGLVYATDIRSAGGELEGVQIVGADRAVNHYAIGAVSAGEAAEQFIEWVLSDEGQAILADHGFGAP